MTTSGHDRCKLRSGGHFASHLDYRLSEKKTYSNLKQSLMKAIHICNLEEIRLK